MSNNKTGNDIGKYLDQDYLEFVIKGLFRDKNVLSKAIALDTQPEDFGGIAIYRVFVAAALKVAAGPIADKLALVTIKSLMTEYGLQISDYDQILELWAYVYANDMENGRELTEEFSAFLKARRFQQIKQAKHEDPESLVNAAQEMLKTVNKAESAETVVSYNPFESLVFKEARETMRTGFPSIDATAGGLGYGEIGLIIGHSGSGKTAMAMFGAVQNCLCGFKVMYLSFEEPAKDVIQRAYSNVFRVDYSLLHKGQTLAQQEAAESFENCDPVRKLAMQNLRVEDMRGIVKPSAEAIWEYIEDYYQNTGWHPDLVYIDQLDFLVVNGKPAEQHYLNYDIIAHELEEVSERKIGGEHPFSIWLIHQAAGQMKRKFGNEAIASCKGVIKPMDMAFCIGRDSAQDKVVSIFSIKCRHTTNFEYDYIAELQYMNFVEKLPGDDEQIKVQNKDAEASRPIMNSTGYKNIPKPRRLPSPSAPFKA